MPTIFESPAVEPAASDTAQSSEATYPSRHIGEEIDSAVAAALELIAGRLFLAGGKLTLTGPNGEEWQVGLKFGNDLFVGGGLAADTLQIRAGKVLLSPPINEGDEYASGQEQQLALFGGEAGMVAKHTTDGSSLAFDADLGITLKTSFGPVSIRAGAGVSIVSDKGVSVQGVEDVLVNTEGNARIISGDEGEMSSLYTLFLKSRESDVDIHAKEVIYLEGVYINFVPILDPKTGKPVTSSDPLPVEWGGTGKTTPLTIADIELLQDTITDLQNRIKALEDAQDQKETPPAPGEDQEQGTLF